MAKISAIVPVYNTEQYLERCLDSLINQTFKDIEIICINDGSPDNSLSILKRYQAKDSRIKIITKENEGPSCARNDGLKLASGEYTSFVDSDDWIDLDFYEKLYSAAKKYDADIAACGIKRLRSYKWKYHLKIEKEEFTEDNNRKFVLCDVPEKCYVWNKIYRTSEIKKYNLGFEPDTYFEDRMFTCQVLVNMKKLVVVPEIYYNYWTNSNSIVKTKSDKKQRDFDYTNKKMMDFLKEHNINLDHHFSEYKKYKLFNLTYFTVKYFKSKRECKLFNVIKFDLPPV